MKYKNTNHDYESDYEKYLKPKFRTGEQSFSEKHPNIAHFGKVFTYSTIAAVTLSLWISACNDMVQGYKVLLEEQKNNTELSYEEENFNKESDLELKLKP